MKPQSASIASAATESAAKSGAATVGKVTAGSSSRRRQSVSASRRLSALCATFLVSGLMHEVLLLTCTGWAAYRPVAGLLTAYFLLQARGDAVGVPLQSLISNIC
jgi:hypothetical protein